jgi:hypothetical protein
MIEVRFTNSDKTYFLPESWSEVSPEQLMIFIKVFHTTESIEEAKLLIIKQWLRIPTSVFTDSSLIAAHKRRYKVNQYLLTEIEDKLVTELQIFFEDFGFERNLIPTIQVPGLNKSLLYGFSDRLENVSADEYRSAAYYYQMYVEDTSNLEYLYLFVACLYRPKRSDGIQPGDETYDGDIRAPFNENNLKEAAAIISKIDTYKLVAVKFCFERIMKWFGDLQDFDLLFKESKNKSEEFTDWDKIIRSVAGQKMGAIERVRKMPIIDVFKELQYLEEELEAAEAAYKSNTPNSQYRTL